MFSSHIPRALGSSLFKNVACFPQPAKEQRAIMIRGQEEKPPESLNQEQQVLHKHTASLGEHSSPKKLKMTLAIFVILLWRQRIRVFSEPVQREDTAVQSPIMHKRSRMLGAKNKKGKVQKKKRCGAALSYLCGRYCWYALPQ